MKNTIHTKNGMPRSVPSGLSGYLYVTGGEEKSDTAKTYSVGEIVRWFQKRYRVWTDLFEGVVLGVVGYGAMQKLLVFDPACEEPEVINVGEAQKLDFENVADDLKVLSKAVLYFKNSEKYFSR